MGCEITIASRILSSNTAEAQTLIAKRCTPEDHAHAALKTVPGAAKNSLLARALVRELLFEATGRGDWHIVANEQGKPYAMRVDGQCGPFISFSHTKGMVAAALCHNCPIGIDIEYHRPRDVLKLAAYAFGPREYDEVRVEGAVAFYRIWTIKEAMAKATGEGILRMIDGSDRTPIISERIYADATWEILYEALQGYSVTVVRLMSAATPA